VKALVLGGGAGTRLRPITHTRAKQLVPVANKPILFYGLEAIAAAGIVEVGVVVGETAAEIREAVGDGSAWGLKVTYLAQEAPLGLAHAVLIARHFLGDDDFVMYLGDNMLAHDLRRHVEGFGGGDAALLLLKRVDDPRRFGVVELDAGGRVVRLVEKPAVPPSDLALVGVYVFSAAVHEAVAAIEPSDRGELEITDAIQWLVDRGRPVRSKLLEGWWVDTGKWTPLLEANRLVLETVARDMAGDVDADSRVEGRVVLERGARLVRSHVRGPAVIGAGTELVDAYVGPFTAVGRRCRVVRSEIEHSVVMDDSRVIDVGRIADSLLGDHVEVTRSEQRPRATRLLLGDHSQVDLGS